MSSTTRTTTGGTSTTPLPLDNVASMSAARDPSPTAPPSKDRDGFSLISQAPIQYDDDDDDGNDDGNDVTHPNSQRRRRRHAFQDITYQVSSSDCCARIAFARPEVLHAFRPQTIREIQLALEWATDNPMVGVIILTSHVDETQYTAAFCSGGDQRVRHDDGGYQDGTEVQPKLRVLDLQIQMRRCPKPIVAVVQGYAIGGGHILHMMADLTLASTNAIFGQSGPRMGSFDAGYGSTHMARLVGQKRARELWFLARYYTADEALSMGLVNAVYSPEELDGRVGQWVRRMMMNSPTALACCKAALNADEDGAAGIAQMGGELTRLFYMSAESQEGRQAFLEKRPPRFRSKL